MQEMRMDHTKILSCSIVVVALVFLAGCAGMQRPGDAARGKEVYETQIIEFTPGVPEAVKTGLCWTRSNIPFARKDVWRCMADNKVMDPCFVAGDRETIICGANPATGEDGFKLDLTTPLPEMTYELGPGTPNLTWMLETGDGTLFQFATGAAGSVEGKRIHYVSKKSSVVIIGDLQPGKVWQAQKAILKRSKNEVSIQKTELVEIRRLWK
jgi:hypothetical protein